VNGVTAASGHRFAKRREPPCRFRRVSTVVTRVSITLTTSILRSHRYQTSRTSLSPVQADLHSLSSTRRLRASSVNELSAINAWQAWGMHWLGHLVPTSPLPGTEGLSTSRATVPSCRTFKNLSQLRSSEDLSSRFCGRTTATPQYV